MTDVVDKTAEIIDDEDLDKDLDAGNKPADAELKIAQKDQQFLKDTLDTYGLDSPEDLESFLENLTSLKGKVADRNLDELIEKAETLEKYQEYWAAQEANKLKDEEDPDETVARLEKELKAIKSSKTQEEQGRKQAEIAEKSIKEFNSEIRTFLTKQEHVPKEYAPFISMLMGVDNPSNEVNLDSKPEIRKMAKSMLKKVEQFEQLVIKRFKDGKTKIPAMSETETPAPDDSRGKKIMNLAEAKKSAFAQLKKHFNTKDSG